MPNNCLDLESIRCFLAAAHHGAFRPAAAAVHLSPPAFGDRIRRLEEDLGARLFERTTRKVRLTEAGRRFAEEAERLLEAEARCRARVLADGQEALPFELTVGTRFELGLSWLLPSLDTLSAAAPERTLHLSFGDTADLLRQLRRGEIDALVTSARLALTDLEYAPLFGETYTFVAARERARAQPCGAPPTRPATPWWTQTGTSRSFATSSTRCPPSRPGASPGWSGWAPSPRSVNASCTATGSGCCPPTSSGTT